MDIAIPPGRLPVRADAILPIILSLIHILNANAVIYATTSSQLGIDIHNARQRTRRASGSTIELCGKDYQIFLDNSEICDCLRFVNY